MSHVFDESSSFVRKFIHNESSLEEYVGNFLPQPRLFGVKTAILEQYPANGSPYWGNATNRTEAVLRDMTFTCNTRLLYDAYHNEANTYMMEYDFLSGRGLAFHASDLLPLFFNPEFDIVPFLKEELPWYLRFLAWTLAKSLNVLAIQYQSYFVSHAIHGDPNTGKKPISPRWNLATNDSNYVKQTMQVGPKLPPFFNPEFTDITNTNEACDFWKVAAWNITNLCSGTSYSPQTPGMQAGYHEYLK